jgi:hypothetical protein
MIGGVVNARHEAVVRLRVRGPGGSELDVELRSQSRPEDVPFSQLAPINLL